MAYSNNKKEIDLSIFLYYVALDAVLQFFAFTLTLFLVFIPLILTKNSSKILTGKNTLVSMGKC